MTLALFGALAATAAVVTPAYLSASGPATPAPVTARMLAHQQMIELLGSLISRSREVACCLLWLVCLVQRVNLLFLQAMLCLKLSLLL